MTFGKVFSLNWGKAHSEARMPLSIVYSVTLHLANTEPFPHLAFLIVYKNDSLQLPAWYDDASRTGKLAILRLWLECFDRKSFC